MPLRFFAYLCLCISQVSLAYPCLRKSSLSISVPLHLSAYLSPCPSSRSTAQPLQIVSKCFFAMPLRCIAERRVSAQRFCHALPPTPRPALPSRFDTRPCIAFALLIEASLIQAMPCLSTPLRCAFQLSLAFAPRCTAVTTCAPAEQTCQHNAVAEFCAHIRAFAKPLQAIQRLCKSYHCRSRSNPIHAMPLLSR